MNALTFLSLLGTANAIICNVGYDYVALSGCPDSVNNDVVNYIVSDVECYDPYASEGKQYVACVTVSYTQIYDGCEIGTAEAYCTKYDSADACAAWESKYTAENPAAV